MPLLNEKLFTVEDVYELPEGERAELIDGKFYLMVPPGRRHQEIVGDLFGEIREFIKKTMVSANHTLLRLLSF